MLAMLARSVCLSLGIANDNLIGGWDGFRMFVCLTEAIFVREICTDLADDQLER